MESKREFTMSFINLFKEKFTSTQNPHHLKKQHSFLFDYFIKLEGSKEFPFILALNSLKEIEESVNTDRALMDCLLEDIIFISIYATFYENLFVSLSQDRGQIHEMIDQFSEESDQREVLIAQQTQKHFDFIKNKGQCNGCECCNNHKDVQELIAPYFKLNLDFFINLYLGMQSIQFTMEHLLYDVFPVEDQAVEDLNHESILKLRQEIINYTEDKLK